MAPARARLAKFKGWQKDKFVGLSERFEPDYRSLSGHETARFTTPLWNDFSAKLESVFLPRPPLSFLRNPDIQKTMFVSGRAKWLDTELNLLESAFDGQRLRSLLEEDFAGDPPLSHARYATSHNSIHHLYHIARYAKSTGVDPAKVRTIVEWGGGYGNLAKIFTRLNGSGLTYTIIDLPLLSVLQWLYLATVLGEERVNMVKGPGDPLAEGKVNVLPVCFVDAKKVAGEMFVSTWALSESSQYAQDYVANRGWFGAKHVLLAYQDGDKSLPDAGRLGEIAASAGMRLEDIDFLPGNHYAFL